MKSKSSNFKGKGEKNILKTYQINRWSFNPADPVFVIRLSSPIFRISFDRISDSVDVNWSGSETSGLNGSDKNVQLKCSSRVTLKFWEYLFRICLLVHLYLFHPSICLFVHLSICPSVYLFICVSVHCLCYLFVCLNSVCLNSVCLNSVCLNSVCLNSVCLNSVCLNSVCLNSVCLNSACLFCVCICPSLCLFCVCNFSSVCLFSVCICPDFLKPTAYYNKNINYQQVIVSCWWLHWIVTW
jgi:hypothetical protein